jgi:uncharacterized protein YdhG (YjbR/CyaY superfamily)
MPNKPRNIDEYLAPLSGEKRAALEKLRRAIHSAAPEAEECISYELPTFRLDGRMLVSFGAAAKHCAFYPGAFPLEAHQHELGAYDTSKGTIRFGPERSLPATLVRKLVQTRIAERRRRTKAVAPTVADHLRGRAPLVRATYTALRKAARSLGPFDEEPKKTSIHWVRTTAFAGIRTRKAGLVLTLKSATEVHSARISKREQASAKRWYFEVPLDSPQQVDRELRAWLKQAYALS